MSWDPTSDDFVNFFDISKISLLKFWCGDVIANCDVIYVARDIMRSNDLMMTLWKPEEGMLIGY